MSHIFGSGPTFAVLTISSILQIMVSWGLPRELFYAMSFKKHVTDKKIYIYKNKVNSPHRLVNNLPRTRPGLIRDKKKKKKKKKN